MIRIYTLTDPRTNLIFYVGASKSTDQLIIARHLGAGAFKGIRKELRQLRLRPILEAIDVANDPIEAGLLEEYWIFQFRSWGFKLDNVRLCSGYEGSTFAMYSKNWNNAVRESELKRKQFMSEQRNLREILNTKRVA
jgi:hypothetical protein